MTTEETMETPTTDYGAWAGCDESEQADRLCAWIAAEGMDTLRAVDPVAWDTVRRDGCPACGGRHEEV